MAKYIYIYECLINLLCGVGLLWAFNRDKDGGNWKNWTPTVLVLVSTGILMFLGDYIIISFYDVDNYFEVSREVSLPWYLSLLCMIIGFLIADKILFKNASWNNSNKEN